MKAISLTQPWATLIAIGAKRIETRSWSTSHRGPIAIHAAKGLGPVGGKRGLKEQCLADFFAAALAMAEDPEYPDKPLPLGAIIATANVVHCLSTNGAYFKMSVGNFEFENGRATSGELITTNYEKPEPGTSEFAFGNYEPNRYMWFLEDVKPLARPIECKGALRFWTVPAEIEAQISDSI